MSIILPRTGGQAFCDLLAGRAPARIPLYDSIWSDTLRDWMVQGYPAGVDGRPLPPADHFGFDLQQVNGGPIWTARLTDEIVEETAEWKTERKGNGAVLRWWKHRSGTPEHIDFAMTDRGVWERDYRPLLVGDLRPRFPDPLRVRQQSAAVRQAGRAVAWRRRGWVR